MDEHNIENMSQHPVELSDRFLGIIPYSIHSLFHWVPRESAFLEALQLIAAPETRIVDVGCAHGLLSKAVVEQGLRYIGWDVDEKAIAKARKRFPEGPTRQFYFANPGTVPTAIDQQDIAVLNGVVHHLDDSSLARLLDPLRNCRAIIILDHIKQERCKYANDYLCQIAQRMDKGKNIRPYSYYQNLSGFILDREHHFSISVFGIPVWQYFCNTYSPSLLVF